MSKPFYGVRPLKKNERYASMTEAANAHQIRYWGVKKADKIVTAPKKKDKTKITLSQAVGMVAGLKTRAKNIIKSIGIAEKKEDAKRVEELKKEYEEVRKRFVEMVPIANKLIQDDEEKRQK